MAITFVTGNLNKLREVSAILGDVTLAHAKLDLPEIQSMSLEDVVRAKARSAFEALKTPILVEDVAVEIEAMGGMPGPFVKFWEQQAGYDRALTLARHENNDRVHLYCGAAYKDAEQEIFTLGKVFGRLVNRVGDNGWGFDPYFLPEGFEMTYAQMGPEQKNQISHRVQAFSKLRDILQGKNLLS